MKGMPRLWREESKERKSGGRCMYGYNVGASSNSPRVVEVACSLSLPLPLLDAATGQIQ